MMNDLKIGGCVVLFNPEIETVENINTYLPFIEQLVVVDNSTIVGPVIQKIRAIEKVYYINMNENAGIAKALNVGLKYLWNQKFDLALTMDQDSKFPLSDFPQIYEYLKKNHKYSVLGLNFNIEIKEKTNTIIDVNCWLTSGNFVNLNDFYAVGGFDSKLFIDYVDIEFGYKLVKSGKKLGYFRDYSLIHSIGNPIEIHLLKLSVYAMNHPPLRYYYRYRNSFYLYHTDKHFFRRFFFHEILVNIPKMLLFEPDKRDKMSMIRAGLKDGRKGILGKYKGKEEISV